MRKQMPWMWLQKAPAFPNGAIGWPKGKGFSIHHTGGEGAFIVHFKGTRDDVRRKWARKVGKI